MSLNQKNKKGGEGMAGRPRKPVAINKKHFTREEREQREAEELQVPLTDVEPPDYLSAKQKKEFKWVRLCILLKMKRLIFL